MRTFPSLSWEDGSNLYGKAPIMLCPEIHNEKKPQDKSVNGTKKLSQERLFPLPAFFYPKMKEHTKKKAIIQNPLPLSFQRSEEVVKEKHLKRLPLRIRPVTMPAPVFPSSVRQLPCVIAKAII